MKDSNILKANSQQEETYNFVNSSHHLFFHRLSYMARLDAWDLHWPDNMLALSLLLAAAAIAAVSGHGGMVWPPIWQDGHYTPLNEIYSYYIYSDPKVMDPNTNRTIKDARSWLTDQAYIGGHGDNFKMTGLQTNFEGCRSFCSTMKTPWSAPGKAPNLGGGCGIFGGNPYGCPAHDDVRPPGSECGDTARGFPGRGIWSYGASALEIDFPQAKNTEWERGSNQWVTSAWPPPHIYTFTKHIHKHLLLHWPLLIAGGLDSKGRPLGRIHLSTLQAARGRQGWPHWGVLCKVFFQRNFSPFSLVLQIIPIY